MLLESSGHGWEVKEGRKKEKGKEGRRGKEWVGEGEERRRERQDLEKSRRGDRSV